MDACGFAWKIAIVGGRAPLEWRGGCAQPSFCLCLCLFQAVVPWPCGANWLLIAGPYSASPHGETVAYKGNCPNEIIYRSIVLSRQINTQPRGTASSPNTQPGSPPGKTHLQKDTGIIVSYYTIIGLLIPHTLLTFSDGEWDMAETLLGKIKSLFQPIVQMIYIWHVYILQLCYNCVGRVTQDGIAFLTFYCQKHISSKWTRSFNRLFW